MLIFCIVYALFMTRKWIYVFLVQGLRNHGTTALNSSIISTTADKSIIVHHVPQCSNNRTFCEDVDFYPEIQFEEILQSSSYSYGKEYFASQNHTSLTNRLYSKKENYLCSSSVKRQYPRVGYNVNKKWRFIYNLHGYKQGIVTEECVTNAACKFLPGAPANVKTKCSQKYTTVVLLVDQEGKPVWDLFLFPSACVCSYEPIINFH
ncbi:unnamed protein product [Tenebrio molitor]|nr:unnamed protein product [Tenebrio molitor]